MRKPLAALTLILIGLVALELLFPKAMLVAFMNDGLWASIGWSDAFAMGVQDLVPVIVLFAALIALVRRPTLVRLIVGCTLSGLLLLALIMDCRVRQLWLKPIDVELMRYY